MSLTDLRTLYTVQLQDATRHTVAQLDSWSSMTLIPRFNDVGSWQIDVPVTSLSTLVTGGGIAIWRNGQWLIGGPYTVLTPSRDASAPAGTVTLFGVDDMRCIADRLAYQDPAHAATAQGAILTDARTGKAETLIRAYVNLNAGPGAVAARQTSGFSLDTDIARGSTVKGAPRMAPLLETIQKLALIDTLGFKVNRSGTNMVFTVYAPRDQSKVVRFSWDLNNIESQSYTVTAPVATREIVGDGTGGTSRVYAEVADTGSESTWSRRIEKFVDGSSTTDATLLTQTGTAQLALDAPTTQFTFVAVDTTTAKYGDWMVGDKVTVVHDGLEYADIVREATFTVDVNGEVIAPVVGSPSATATPATYKVIRQAIAAIASLARKS